MGLDMGMGTREKSEISTEISNGNVLVEQNRNGQNAVNDSLRKYIRVEDVVDYDMAESDMKVEESNKNNIRSSSENGE